MKKIITLFMTLIFAFSFAGCTPNKKEIGKPTSNSKTEEKTPDNNTTSNSKTGEKIITLSLMYKSPYIDVAINKFQKLHPDIKVEIKNAIQDMNDPSNYEKYVKNVNAEIMAGKGADIISMLELPYRKYADKKMLVNLNDVISKDKEFNIKNYNENIINAFKYNGGIYSIPIDYEFSTFVANKKILDEEKINIDDKNLTWKELISIGQKLTKDKNNDGTIDQYGFTKMDTSILMECLLSNQYNKFVDEDKKQAKFDSKEFIDILNIAKELNDKKIMDINGIDGTIMMGGSGIQMLYTNKDKSAFTINYIEKYAPLGENLKLVNLHGEGNQKGSSFVSLDNFSINKNSKYQNECWEFIKFMLSEEMQTVEGLAGFPVNKTALDKVSKQAIEVTKGQKFMLTQQDVEKMNQFISNLSNVNNENMQIKKIIDHEADKFIKGQKTAKQVSETIQNKINTMLNE